MTEPLGCRGGLSRARDGEIDVGTTGETPGRSSGGIDVEVVRGGGSHTPLLTLLKSPQFPGSVQGPVSIWSDSQGRGGNSREGQGRLEAPTEGWTMNIECRRFQSELGLGSLRDRNIWCSCEEGGRGSVMARMLGSWPGTVLRAANRQ